ncbi:transcriptional regulator PpsR [Jannaschia faecimaris]|uniref:Transcriptional regulator PpsR n=1 Tax=Jannaschia faecimaris TaxID=1244108 RepID=A0A1H3JIJ2_9RHOB|nr:PAS domain-containing protein [Jannaschia faecimaris]SDY39751.1 transcriptional regulator PpsR [Jannaschia faecimaris]
MSVRKTEATREFDHITAETSIADVIFVLSSDDHIVQIRANGSKPLPESDDWVGKRIYDILSRSSQAQFIRARKSLDEGVSSRARTQISLPLDDRSDLVLSVVLRSREDGYQIVGLDQSPLADAVARADRLQSALEAAHEEDHMTKGLNRILLTHLESAIVLVDAHTGRILDLSKPAVALLGLPSDTHGAFSTGMAFTQCFEGRRRSEFIDSLCSAASSNRTVTAELRGSNGTVVLRPQLSRASDPVILVCRLTHLSDAGTSDGPQGFTALSQASPDSMICLDDQGHITRMNPAFLRMVGAASESVVADRSITGFLLRGTIDLKAMTDQNRPRTFSTQVVGLTGQRLPVEITVSDLPDGGHGLILRDVSLANVIRDTAETQGTAEQPLLASADAARQVGRVPLRDIVASMTDTIERDCVEAAINLTQNNRVAAAEMLGLSRQSLYVKLRKFGLLDKGDQ